MPINEHGYALIDAELQRLQIAAYSELMASIGTIDRKKIVGEDGKLINSRFRRFGTQIKVRM